MLIPKIHIFLNILKVDWASVCVANLVFFHHSLNTSLLLLDHCSISPHSLYNSLKSGSPPPLLWTLLFPLTSLLCKILPFSVTLLCPGFPDTSLTSLHLLSLWPSPLFAWLNAILLQDSVTSFLFSAIRSQVVSLLHIDSNSVCI